MKVSSREGDAARGDICALAKSLAAPISDTEVHAALRRLRQQCREHEGGDAARPRRSLHDGYDASRVADVNSDDNDRFGIPDAAFRAARESHGADNPLVRWGSYVPTRREVATLNPGDLTLILDGWMWESPTEFIPSQEQIRQVRDVLRQRSDGGTDGLKLLIALCDKFLTPTSETDAD